MRTKATLRSWRAAAFAAIATLFAAGAHASVSVAVAPASVENGHTAAVAATVSSSSTPVSVKLSFSLSGASDAAEGYTGNIVEMTPGGAQGEYAGFIPILPAGTLHWRVLAEYDDGTTEQSDEQTTVISAELGYDYYHDMKGKTGISSVSGDFYNDTYGWVQDTATYGAGTTNFFAIAPNGSRWIAHGVSWAPSNTRSQHVPNTISTGRALTVATDLEPPVLYFWNILPAERSFIQTPRLPDGIGAFTFRARNVAGTSNELQFQVLRSDDVGNGNWDTEATYSLSTANSLYAFTNILNDSSIRYARIVRTAITPGGNVANGVVSIDDMQATPPNPRLNLHKGMVAPAAPITSQPIAIQCLASNVNESIPAFNKSATVHYVVVDAESGTMSSLQSAPMSYLGETNGCALFEGTIPAQDNPCTIRYFFNSEFDGYYFTSKAHDGVPSPVYLYGDTSTTDAPTAPSQYFSISVSARVYKVIVESAPDSLSIGNIGTIVATDNSGNTPTSVKLWFKLAGSNFLSGEWQSLDMSVDAETGKYIGNIPILPAGTLSWRVEATYGDGTTEPSTLHETTISGDLDYNRFHDMKATSAITTTAGYYTNDYGWVQDMSKPSNGNGTYYNNFYATAPNGSRWLAHGVGWAYSNTRAQHVPNNISSARSITVIGELKPPILYFWNTPDYPYLQSPVLVGGVGVFSVDVFNQSGNNTLLVQVSHIEDPEESYPSDDWIDKGSKTLNEATDTTWELIINDIAVKRLRLVRVSHSSNQQHQDIVSIDNIRITPASPDIEMKEVLRNPGYPAIDEEIKLRCAISNICETTPAFNFAVTSKFSLADYRNSSVTGWTSVAMDFVCETNGWLLYECTIPAQGQPGWLHYFFEATFEGFCFSSREENGWNSPKYLYAGTSTTNAPATYPPHLGFEVRQFKSRYSGVYLVKAGGSGDTGTETTPLSLVGDNLWQASLPVDANTSPEVYFYGRDAYVNDADSFIAEPFYYGDNDQDTPYETPTGGRPERLFATIDGLSGIRIDVSSGGYLIYWLKDSASDRDLNYTVKRGVYQDFDDWEVDGAYYTRTFSGSTIGTNTDDFDGWASPTRYPEEETKTENFLSEEAFTNNTVYADVLTRDSSEFIEGTTWNAWELYEVRLAVERVTNATATVENPVSGCFPFTNTTAHVKAGGFIYNSDGGGGVGLDAIPYGLGRISATARLAIADGAMAIYNGQSWTYGYDNNNAMFIEASFNIPLETRPNSHYYAAIVFDWIDENNYRELRYVRADTSSGVSDNRFRVELWRCCAGTLERYATSGFQSHANVASDQTVVVKLRTRFSGNGSKDVNTAYQVSVGSQTYWNNFGTNNTDNKTPKMDDAGSNGGKIGFYAYDCAPKLNYIKAYRKTGGTDSEMFGAGSAASVNSGSVPSSFADTADSWSFGGVDETCSGTEALYKWFIDTSAAGDGALRRRIPSVTLEIAATDYNPSGAPSWSSAPILASPVLDSLLFSTISIDVHAWQKKQVRFKNASPAGNYAVFDSISLIPWRAVTRDSASQYGNVGGINSYEWDSPSTQLTWADDGSRDNNWLIFEGWAETNSMTRDTVSAAFEPSQSNPDLIQALVSPIMTNGIGTVRFDYGVASDGAPANGKIVYVLEYTDSGSTTVFGNLVETFTNYVGETGFHSKDISVNYRESDDDNPEEMRLRIRILRDESDADAILFLDNVFINDYPPETEDMWKVYNGRIPPAANEPSRVYGGAGKSLFLNNAPDAGLPPRSEAAFTAWDPFLQAPRIAEGIGEVSFMYRAYDGTPGLIRISISPEETFDDESWTEITNIVVTGSGYIKFDDPSIYKTASHFVRISTETGSGYGRVCIDNVMVAEPSRPSFKISTVNLIPRNPTAGEDLVAVNAQLTRIMQSPTNIHIYVSFNTNTNTWGYTNWWPQTKFDNSAKIELFDDGTGTNFTSAAGTGLPARNARDIVQYIVWGIHSKVSPDLPADEVYFQEESSFSPPATGTDYNELYGGYSPFYFVLSCEPGAVWFNEIWHSYGRAEATYPDGSDAFEFIELAGKSGVDISGWQIKAFTSAANYERDKTAFDTITIPDGTRLQGPGGWGFWVAGDGSTPNGNYDTGTAAGARDLMTGTTLALLLIRGDSGDIEQAVYLKTSAGSGFPFGGASTYISSPAKTARNGGAGYSYALLDEPNGNISTSYDSTTNTTYTSEVAGTDGSPRVWYWTLATPTPGEANRFEGSISQTFTPSGTSVYNVISTIASGYGHGTHNGTSSETVTIEVPGGGSTSVVYVAGDWYKIVALTSNGSAVADAAGKSTYTHELPSVAADVQLNVSFGPKTSADDSRWTDAILDWFRANGWSEAAIEAGDGDEWSVAQEFLLGTDPTVNTSVECSTTSISLDGEDVTLGLGLVREENGGSVVSPVNGAVNIYGMAALGGAESLVVGASIPSGAFNGTEGESVTFSKEGLGLSFFIWRIE